MEKETELLTKVKVTELYQTKQTVVIGDSVTAIHIAMKGALFLARHRPSKCMEEANKDCTLRDNFSEVRNYFINFFLKGLLLT